MARAYLISLGKDYFFDVDDPSVECITRQWLIEHKDKLMELLIKYSEEGEKIPTNALYDDDFLNYVHDLDVVGEWWEEREWYPM